MTRKSKREIERAVEDLGGGDRTAAGWVERYIESNFLGDGPGNDVASTEYVVYNSDGEIIHEPDHGGEVKIWEARCGIKMSIWASEETVPAWVDHDDLPVRK